MLHKKWEVFLWDALLTLTHIFNIHSAYYIWMPCEYSHLERSHSLQELWLHICKLFQRLVGLSYQLGSCSWVLCLHSKLSTAPCYRHLNNNYEELNSLIFFHTNLKERHYHPYNCLLSENKTKNKNWVSSKWFLLHKQTCIHSITVIFSILPP